MKAIIFGANGQDGFYLTKLLQQKNVEVTGVSRGGHFLHTDLTNLEEVAALIKSIRPDFIFHLAANSTTKHEALFENHETIATGTLNILESVKQFSPDTKVFISGSGLQFLNEGQPIKESNPFAANDAYAISRIQSVYAARYFRKIGLKVYVGYFFNHDSPLRSERHMAKKISATAARIAKGSNEKLEIGDMDAVKEWSFAGDIVKGIWLLVNQENVFEANISNGEGHSIQEWVKLCFNIEGLNYTDHVIKAEGFTGAYRQLVSDNSLIKSLGYVPEVSFEMLAKKMLTESE
jgi:GDPmannose 4,6-dehydratase